MKFNKVEEDLSKKFFKVLDKKYSNASRKYHNWYHILDILSTFDKFTDKIENINALRWAAFYHDAIQSQFSKKNEEKSAALAEKHMKKAGIAEVEIELTKYFILKTKDHFNIEPAEFFDVSLFLDADLSILGVTEFEYEMYAQNIKKEYSFVPNPLFAKGRKAILSRMLESEKIFRLPQFSDYEKQARINIKWELANI